MKAKHLITAALVGASSLAGSLFVTPPAFAQSATTGAIQGVVKDATNGEALIGVTVVVAGPTIKPQTVITDENGFYKVTELPPSGDYIVTFYYISVVLERRNIPVGINKVSPVYIKIDPNESSGGETIVVVDSVPTIDPTSTTQGITLDSEYLNKIPVPGRTFESALGAAAGSQGDALGVAFSGSTSLENQYIVDGVNTTSLQYGTSGTPVINDFIEEIEVITGGYNAEYGRATGGVVNVVTKSGTNEIAGSVFAAIEPGALVASRDRAPSQATSIDAQNNLDYQMDVGFEIGGPIIKDKAWFWVGFDPQFSSTTTTRITKRRTDCRETLPSGELNIAADQPCNSADPSTWVSDGTEDIDPETGFLIYEDLDSSDLKTTSRAYAILGKVNFALSPEHQGQVSFTGLPGSSKGQYTYAYVDQEQYEENYYTADTAAKWTSKFNDNKTEVEGVLGFHRSAYEFGSLDGARDRERAQILLFGNLGEWSRLGGETMATQEGCTDNAGGDPYEFITNCPDVGVGYVVGGPGNLSDDAEQRLSARLSMVQRVTKALGTHEIKAGVDIEQNTIDNSRKYSGDAILRNLQDRAEIYAYRWVKLGGETGDPDVDAEQFPNACRDATLMSDYQCRYLTQDDAAAQVKGETVNWSAYLRDSWQVRPNITFNYGLRYEEQRLRYVEDLQNSTDPLTGRELGKNAMVMNGMWAPRLGALYDWTKEGRSKLYAHWGRFYESIPLQINNRSFGGEVQFEQHFSAADQCGVAVDGFGGPDGNGCLVDPDQIASADEILFGSGTLVQPGIKPQYMDERILGVEYEVMEDLKLGLAYQNRSLGRVIEDVSVDGAQTYIIANPGEWSADEEQALRDQIERTDDDTERNRLVNELDQFLGIRIFDKPQRDYNALQFTVTRRFSKALYMQGSYTFSRTEGNFPGLFSPDNGQVDPNISSQYDLIELLANRNGPLPQDRPHYVKLDAYYTFDFKKAGEMTTGVRFRALSGTPVNVLGRHYRYGTSESFILPRGSLRRNDFETGIDLHVDYARELARGMKASVYADLFNLLNDQGTFSVDQNYTYLSNVNPIVGGTYEDLIFAKEQAANSGAETNTPIQRNPNFGNIAGRYGPLSVRFGFKLTF